MRTSRWPISHLPISDITPFTYRDGETYLELLNRLSQYITEQLHPNLRKTVEHMVEEMEHILAAQHNKYVEGIQDFQRIHDAFMTDVNSALMALNDNAVSDLVGDPGSTLGSMLRELFADRDQVEEAASWITLHQFGYDPTQSTTHATSINAGLRESAQTGKPLKLPERAELTMLEPLTLYSGSNLLGSHSVMTFPRSPGTYLSLAQDIRDVHIQDIEMFVYPVDFPDQRGLHFQDARNISLENVKVLSSQLLTGRNGLSYGAIRFTDSQQITLQDVEVYGWSFAISTRRCSNLFVNDTLVRGYRTGFTLVDTRNAEFNRVNLHTNDRSHIDNHGGMGVLVEATIDNASENIVFNDVESQDSASHAFRLGGQRRIRNVYYNRCVARNTQRGGFKTLGGSTIGSNYHQNIHYNDCQVIDCGNDAENSDGFQIELTNNVTILNPKVVRENKSYSCGAGISVKGCTSVSVVNPFVRRSRLGCFRIHPQLGDVSDVSLDGGDMTTTMGNVVEIDMPNRNVSRVKILNYPTMSTSDGSALYLNVPNDSGIIMVSTHVPYSATPIISDDSVSPRVIGNILSPFNEDIESGHFANGSTWQARGNYYIKFGGKWRTVNYTV